MWEVCALWAFGLTVASGYWLAWDELVHVPIKLSWLGKGRAYAAVATGFLATGACLVLHHQQNNDSLLLVGGDVLVCGIGIVNGKEGWRHKLHAPLVLAALSMYALFLASAGYYLACSMAAACYVVEHALSFPDRFGIRPTSITFRAAAICQYLCILAVGPSILYPKT